MNRWLLLTLMGVVGAGFLACSSDDSNDKTTTPVVEQPKPLVFGMTIALTGDLKGFGQPGQNAARVAESQLNALGGILGREVKYKVVDDQTQDDAAIATVTDFVNEGVMAIIGPTNSSQAVKTHQLAFDKQILMISATASTPALSGCPEGQTMGCSEPMHDRYFFRTTASHKLQGKTIAIFASEGPTPEQACKKMAIIHNDDGYGNPIAAEVTTQMMARSGQVIADVKIPSTVKANYQDEAKQVVAAQPDCQLLIMFPPAGVQYMKDFTSARDADTTHDWSKMVSIGANGLKIDDFIVSGRQNPADATSPTIGEGMYATIADTNPPTSEYQAFKNIYTQQFPLDSGQADLPTYTANLYDACILPALAIQLAGTVDDRAKIRDSLYAVSHGNTPDAAAYGPDQIADILAAIKAGRDVNYKGASGPVDFDDGGDVLNDFVVWKIENGAFKVFSRVGVEKLKLEPWLMRSAAALSWVRRGLLLPWLLALAGCAKVEEKPSDPTPWQFQINFLSKDAAISADSLEISVFDATVDGADCQSLTQKRRTHQELPATAAPVANLSVCSILADGTVSATTPYGDYSVLVVAKRGTKDWLLGCQTQQVSAQAPAVLPTVGLTPFDNTVQIQAASGCSSVGQFCQQQCQRP